MTTSIIRFLNIVIAALLAGVSFGIWVGFNPSGLSAATYVEQQQNMLRGLKVLMVSMVFLATIITLVAAYLQKNNRPVLIALLAAAGLLIACILITRFGNKPIDDQVLAWTRDTIPSDWTAFRDKWWSFHIQRMAVELIALCLITWTGIRKD